MNFLFPEMRQNRNKTERVRIKIHTDTIIWSILLHKIVFEIWKKETRH